MAANKATETTAREAKINSCLNILRKTPPSDVEEVREVTAHAMYELECVTSVDEGDALDDSHAFYCYSLL